MEKESINGGAKGQCPVMEIAFRKGRSCFLIQEPRGRESMGVCVCVWVVVYMCEVEDVPFCRLFFSFRRRKQGHKLKWKEWLDRGVGLGKVKMFCWQ